MAVLGSIFLLHVELLTLHDDELCERMPPPLPGKRVGAVTPHQGRGKGVVLGQLDPHSAAGGEGC
jgi:hypothetical protein